MSLKFLWFCDFVGWNKPIPHNIKEIQILKVAINSKLVSLFYINL